VLGRDLLGNGNNRALSGNSGRILPGALTLVVLMGLRTRGELASRLVARGWSAATPTAIVLGASHAGRGALDRHARRAGRRAHRERTRPA